MRRWIGVVGVIGAAVALTVLPLRPSLAWGPEGHRVIALIALQRSDPGTRAKILAILATDKGDRLTKPDIASEATWADVLREKSEEARDATAPWHSTRFKPDSPDLATACFGRSALPAGYPASHGPRENCSVDKIEQFASELKNPETSQFEKLAALQFLLNLVGDLNDPLHAIDRGDQGGECVAVEVGSNPPVRLSSYWENTLATEVAGPDPARGAARIAASVPVAEAQKLAEGTPETWARDTFEVARSLTYSFTAGPPQGKHTFPPGKGEVESCPSVDLYRVGLDYETKALATVKQQLAKAGLRLARVLSDSLK
ncbi:MAG: S1/P1 nuclease [Alphaproteobacteria bacterium]